MDMWVIETCGDISKICATREIALREVLRMLKEWENNTIFPYLFSEEKKDF